MGFISTFAKHSEHCGCCKTYSKQPPPPRHFSCQLWVILTWTSKQQDPPSPPLYPLISSDNSVRLWSARWTSPLSSNSHGALRPQCVVAVKPPHCATLQKGARAPGVLSSESKGASSGAVVEPTASRATHYYMRGGTCDLFNYSALHFYPTIQNATWELIASKIHLYNLPQAHKLSNFGAGWTSRADTSRSLSHQSPAVCRGRRGEPELNGAALLRAEKPGGG